MTVPELPMEIVALKGAWAVPIAARGRVGKADIKISLYGFLQAGRTAARSRRYAKEETLMAAKQVVVSDTAAAPVDDRAPVVRSLSALRKAENESRRCPLYANATQAVPGEGPNQAKVMLVGEQ